MNSNKTEGKGILDYEQLVAHSLIYVVKEALEITSARGLPDGHYFNITFLTTHPDVEMSQALLNKYPEEMTVVLQYEFNKLQVDNCGFSVVLSFANVPSKIYIPFDAIRFFIDPAANFGLQFNPVIPEKKSASSTVIEKAPAKATTAKKDDSKGQVIDFKTFKK